MRCDTLDAVLITFARIPFARIHLARIHECDWRRVLHTTASRPVVHDLLYC